MNRHAFTLIELLVVIAIIAIITIVLILVLNPAEILRKGRDANRLSDIPTLNTALSAYADDVGDSMGSSSVTYISIPDPTATTTAGTDCSGIGFPFAGGGSFHCAASSTFRNVNGTGWIPINLKKESFGSSLGSLPADPINTTSSNEYYTYQTDGTTYKITAHPESQTYIAQAGMNPNLFSGGANLALDGGTWVLVPGNPTFGTNTFYVMKYEAVCSDGKGNYINDNNTGYNTYNNSAYSCNTGNGRVIASLAGGWPVADISQTTSAAYCAAIGAHLITNNEWQTIAWNAESQASNWSGGVVGSGYIYAGHIDDAPDNALVASTNDSQGYFGETNTGGNQKRTLVLSNGGLLWDISGNLWDWTSDTITGTNEPHGSAAGFNFYEFTSITTFGAMSQTTAGAINSAWNSTQSIGEIYSENAVDATTYAIRRGGDWALPSPGGIESLALDNTPANAFLYIGLRCAR